MAACLSALRLRCGFVGPRRFWPLPSFFTGYAKQDARLLHWAKARKKRYPKDVALRHFDEFYGNVYGKSWPSIRIALLSPRKYAAVVNSFLKRSDDILQELKQKGALNLRALYEREKLCIPSDQGDERKLDFVKPDDVTEDDDAADPPFDSSARIVLPGAVSLTSTGNPLLSFVPSSKMVCQEEIINEGDYYNFYKPKPGMVVPVKRWNDFDFPEQLRVAVFATGDISLFPPPKQSSGGLFEYYLMDGASVLPVLALGLQKGERFGDFCAAPGGKFLATQFTLLPGSAFGCDTSGSRLKRFQSVLTTYIPKGAVSISVEQQNILTWTGGNLSFDKILLDVPCTNDRHSLEEDDNNYFHPNRLSERLALPQKQMDMLSLSLRCLSPGGSLVYSTCTLSPIQNDGVVHMALQHLWETTSMEFVVVDLAQPFAPLKGVFRFFPDTKYGQAVLPFLPNNYGPMYICKLERVR